jgi:hypothetical protein
VNKAFYGSSNLVETGSNGNHVQKANTEILVKATTKTMKWKMNTKAAIKAMIATIKARTKAMRKAMTELVEQEEALSGTREVNGKIIS